MSVCLGAKGLLSLLLALAAFSSTLAQAPRSSKRGLVYVPSAENPADDSIWSATTSDLTWYYNYQASPSAAYANSRLSFVPMLWGVGDSNDTSFLDSVTSQLKSGANITHVLTFNEPDGTQSTGGSNISPSAAAAAWMRQVEPLKDRGVKLGAPAVTGAPSGMTWLKNFVTACHGNCSFDFVPVHWYGNFEGLASHIGEVQATFNLSIWVTEFANANANLQDSQSFYNMSTQYLDRLEYVDRYTYFGSFRSSVSNVGPNAAMLNQNGQLTDIGSWYLGGSATGNLPSSARSSRASGAQYVITAFALMWGFL